jgi:uncharacterized damage-inducible protein DinB
MQITVNITTGNIEHGKRPDLDQRPLARAFMRLGEPVQTLLRTLLIFLLVPAAAALAQGNAPTAAAAAAPQSNPLTTHMKHLFGGTKRILLRSAEKMPEENYAFKPTETVRSYGQIVGHVADSQYAFCSMVLGEKNPAPKIEQTKTSKADLIAALKDAFAYCDKAYEGLTDASAVQLVKFMDGDRPKLGVLTVNNVHTIEHYGNLVTYMRIKNIVPPTSDPEFMKQLSK